MQNRTTVKRIIIVFAYIALLFFVGFMIYLIKSPEATCSDGKKNQAEKGVDCGGPCTPCKDIVETKDLKVDEIAIADGGNGTYDVVAKISNPNDSVGAKELTYKFTLKNSEGKIVAQQSGKSFILPADSRYISQLGISTENSAVAVSASIEMADIKWQQVSGVGKPQIGVYSKKFEKSPMGEGSEAEGIIRNESNYDLKEIGITVILRDERGKIVGVNTTKKNSVRMKEERDFMLTWPYSLGTSVQKMEVDPQVNIFDPQNLSI